jgi:protease-4
MEALYETFLRRVADGRKLAPESVERVAEGRVWSGLRALGLGLVDGLGGPLEAIREARRRAGLADSDRVRIEILPRIPRLAGLRALVGLAFGGRED